MTNVSLADWISGLSFESLPQRVRSRAKLAVFDTCGVALAGTHHPAAQHVRGLIADKGSAPLVRIIGDPSLRVSQLDAAWLLGTMADAFLYSNVHHPSGGQFTSVLLPVLLAVSEVRQISGPEALTAYVAGYEVATRLVMASDSSGQNRHVTAAAGTMGAAATAGRLLGLIAGAVAACLGIGCRRGGRQRWVRDPKRPCRTGRSGRCPAGRARARRQ